MADAPVVDPTQDDPYGAEYQKQMLAKLAPQVEATVARLFPHARGARFGAQGAILAKAMAKLQLEIATHAAERGAAQKEQLRREAVSKQTDQERFSRQQGEKIRQESNVRTENERNRSLWERYQQDQPAQEKAQTERALKLKYAEDPNREAKVKSAMDYLYPEQPKQPGLLESLSGMWKNRNEGKWTPSTPNPDFAIPTTTAKYNQEIYPNTIEKRDYPDIPGEQPIPAPLAGERGGSDVASLGPVKGPGAPTPQGLEAPIGSNMTATGWKSYYGEPSEGRQWGGVPGGTATHGVPTNPISIYRQGKWYPIEFAGKGIPSPLGSYSGGGVYETGKFGSGANTPSTPRYANFWGKEDEDKRKANQEQIVKTGYPYSTSTDSGRGRYNSDLWSGSMTPGSIRSGFNNTVSSIKNGWRSLWA